MAVWLLSRSPTSMVPLAFFVNATSPMSGPAGKRHAIFALRRFVSVVMLRSLHMPLFASVWYAAIRTHDPSCVQWTSRQELFALSAAPSGGGLIAKAKIPPVAAMMRYLDNV